MYSWKKGIAKWAVGDRLYISVPFTWLMEEARTIAANWHGEALIGGPGTMTPSDCQGYEPILFHNPLATFTTRGCVNQCGFCAVPKLEGEFRELSNFRPAPMVCDNNLLASSRVHLRDVVDSLKRFEFVDFNQGLEARRFTPEIADLLGGLKCKVRFAFDSWGMEAAVKDAVDLCRSRTTRDIGIYCLIGYKDDPESARARLELVRSWGIRPNPMRFQPLDASDRNPPNQNPAWTEEQLSQMTRFYSRLRFLEHIPFDEYKSKPQLELL